MSDRKTPAIVAQRVQVSTMNYDECLDAYCRIDQKRSVKSACGKFSSYPATNTPFQRLLVERMDGLALAERLSKILGESK